MKASMNIINSLNEPVALQSKTLAPDGFGGFNESFAATITLWSRIVNYEAKTKDKNNSRKHMKYLTLQTRLNKAIKIGDRITHDAHQYEITDVSHERKPGITKIICESII